MHTSHSKREKKKVNSKKGCMPIHDLENDFNLNKDNSVVGYDAQIS